MATVTLKQDWDYQPRLGTSKGHHVSRRDEQKAVADFVERRDEGSLLVVGRRGSGKTSLVITAVNRAKRLKLRGKTLVPVLVKATSLEGNELGDKKLLLVSLIRQLRREVREGGNKRMASEIRSLHENATAAKKSRVRTSSRTAHRSLRSGAFLAFFATLIIYLSNHPWMDEHPWMLALVGGLAALMPAIYYNYEKRDEVDDVAVHDYGLADMQQEFEQILQKHSRTHKIVFILDEFDKGGQSVAAIMAPLKMLINQGGALYIFITSPDKAGDVRSRQSPDYTVFSQTLYLKRSLFEEMDEFINAIVDERSGDLADDKYDDLRHYLCYRSRADFFDLYRAVRDRQTGIDKGGRPVIDADLSRTELTAANLQRAIRYVYTRKSFGLLSEQAKNDDMLEAMYKVAAALVAVPGIPVSVDSSHIGIGGIKEESRAHEVSAVRDLLAALVAEGYISESADRYAAKGELSTFTGGTHVEEERALGQAYGALLDAAVDLANCVSLLDGHGGGFDRSAVEGKRSDLLDAVGSMDHALPPDDMVRCVQDLDKPGTASATPDQLRSHTNTARQNLGMIRTSSVDLLARAFGERMGIVTDIGNALDPGGPLNAGLSDREVHNAASAPPDAGSDIRLVIVDAQDPAVSESIRSTVSRDPQVNNTVVILLVGGDVPPGLAQACFVVGSIDQVGKVAHDAMDRARDRAAYAFALTSPPSPEQLDLMLATFGKIREWHLGGARHGFDAFMGSLAEAIALGGTEKRRNGDSAANAETGRAYTLNIHVARRDG